MTSLLSRKPHDLGGGGVTARDGKGASLLRLKMLNEIDFKLRRLVLAADNMAGLGTVRPAGIKRGCFGMIRKAIRLIESNDRANISFRLDGPWMVLIACHERGLDKYVEQLCEYFNRDQAASPPPSSPPPLPSTGADGADFSSWPTGSAGRVGLSKHDLLLLAYIRLDRIESMRQVIKEIVDQRVAIRPEVASRLAWYVLYRKKRARAGIQMALSVFNMLLRKPDYPFIPTAAGGEAQLAVRLLQLYFETENLDAATWLYNSSMDRITDAKQRRWMVHTMVRGLARWKDIRRAMKIAFEDSSGPDDLRDTFTELTRGLFDARQGRAILKLIKILEASKGDGTEIKSGLDMHAYYLYDMVRRGKVEEAVETLFQLTGKGSTTPESIEDEGAMDIRKKVLLEMVQRVAKTGRHIDLCNELCLEYLRITRNKGVNEHFVVAVMNTLNYAGEAGLVVEWFTAIWDRTCWLLQQRCGKGTRPHRQPANSDAPSGAVTDIRKDLHTLAGLYTPTSINASDTRPVQRMFQGLITIVFNALGNSEGRFADLQAFWKFAQRQSSTHQKTSSVRLIQLNSTNYHALIRAVIRYGQFVEMLGVIRDDMDSHGIEFDPKSSAKLMRMLRNSARFGQLSWSKREEVLDSLNKSPT
ncbi:hypothetical protein EV182_003429 [Spiromyces aspiralis]|uniref:Uncharacterized protein n=1 Tax=Spiromyces aspiralis TaxID=68401 RepID=A0ACC1HG70_9FUNG|nr:hypothetical protein EV182_003429 [Spiromyces aspiralis]